VGGWGSGSWIRWPTKPVVEDGLTLDLCRLIREGLVVPGSSVAGSLVWRHSTTGGETFSVGYHASLLSPGSGWLRLYYTAAGMSLDYRIELTVTRPYFGGTRWWFVCPVEGVRAAKLYSPPRSCLFLSRKGLRLAYRSQNQGTWERQLRVAQAIRVKLGGTPNLADPFPDKPKGMHWKTYFRLRKKAGWVADRGMFLMARRLKARA